MSEYIPDFEYDCEICGKPAASVAVDIQETEPVKDEKGQLWKTFQEHSRHFFCAAHRRESIEYPRLGETT